MQISTIKVPAGTKYLSEVMSTLPENCLFNKEVVRSGGTTIALTNNSPTLVCVPFVSLNKNKIKQSEEKANKLGVFNRPKFISSGGSGECAAVY